MIGDIQKAVTAYRKLSPLGRRLFRDEVGLAGPLAGRKRRKVKTPDGRTLRVSVAEVKPKRARVEATDITLKHVRKIAASPAPAGDVPVFAEGS